ncbi:MAG TPA: hypothetical protein VJV78_04190, partial [Polyangiales bacterium]|nr:hypothetical protein [Polyangiales bacterium]
MSAAAAAELARLAQLWEAERLAAREQAREERLRLTLAERVERGIALRSLVLEDADAALGGRALLWFKPQP